MWLIGRRNKRGKESRLRRMRWIGRDRKLWQNVKKKIEENKPLQKDDLFQRSLLSINGSDGTRMIGKDLQPRR